MEMQPPKWADKLLSLFCKGNLLEEIQGDLHEYYHRETTAKGKFRAGWMYWYHVFNFIRPFAIKRTQNSNYRIMFKYNLIIAYRNMLKHRFYSLINISGLAIAVTSSLLIGVFVLDELSYDKHFTNAQNIYRVAADIKFENNEFNLATSPAPLAQAFGAEIPEVKLVGRLHNDGAALFRKGDRFVKQEHVGYADQSVLEIFDFDFIYGARANALEEPNSIIISRTTSENFFGYEDPIGRNLESLSGNTYQVTGVYNDIPDHSHFHPQALISMENEGNSNSPIWLSNNYYTYLMLHDGAKAEDLRPKIDAIIDKYVRPQVKELTGVTLEDMSANGGRLNYYLVPLEDIHLYSNQEYQWEQNGSIEYVYIFSAVGIFILVLACINFMNLSTAKSAGRAKEVGMRKVLGSQKKQLIAQFLTESVLYSLVSFGVAVMLTYLLLPILNDFTSKQIMDPIFGRLALWPYVLIGSLVVGILAGVYPAFFLTAFRPAHVLKGELRNGISTSHLRNILVVFQFAVSIILIVGTAVVYKQLDFSRNKRLGYDKEKVIIIKNSNSANSGSEAFKTSLLALSDVTSVTSTTHYPSGESRNDLPFVPEGKSVLENTVSAQVWSADVDYLETFRMNLISGRNFDPELASDSSGIIINQTMAKRIGYEDPIGKFLKPAARFNFIKFEKFRIIGVVEDFHFESFKQSIVPMVLSMGANKSHTAIRYNSDSPAKVLSQVRNIWEEHAEGRPMDYVFLDDDFHAKFQAEERLATIFGTFSLLAIAIACLGLFGLSSFTAERRKKEIGIRKVLGASIYSIVTLLFSTFTKLLGVSFVIAVPVAYLLMQRWLDGFIYKTTLSLDVFALACGLVFLLAWLTVSFQSYRAASADPVKNLKYE